MKKAIVLLILCVFMLAGCQSNIARTTMEFNFNTSEPSDSYDEKTIYIDGDRDKVEFDASLSIDSGEASIKVVSVKSGAIIWDKSYKESADFSIVLNDLETDSEYVIKIQATNNKTMSLKLSSDDNLVKEVEKPEKKEVTHNS